MTIGPEDDLTTYPLFFDAEGLTLYMFDSRNRDTSALVAVDAETGDAHEVAADPRADVAGTMIHPVTRHPQAVARSSTIASSGRFLTIRSQRISSESLMIARGSSQ